MNPGVSPLKWSVQIPDMTTAAAATAPRALAFAAVLAIIAIAALAAAVFGVDRWAQQ